MADEVTIGPYAIADACRYSYQGERFVDVRRKTDEEFASEVGRLRTYGYSARDIDRYHRAPCTDDQVESCSILRAWWD